MLFYLEITNVNPAIVIDNGSKFTKAAFAGEDSPRVKLTSVVGRPHHSVIIYNYVRKGTNWHTYTA